MKDLPWNGATFPDQAISEEGRQFLLSLLGQLSAAQLEDLFDGSRVELSEGVTAEGRQAAGVGGRLRRQDPADTGGGALFMNLSTPKSQAPNPKALPTPNFQAELPRPLQAICG